MSQHPWRFISQTRSTSNQNSSHTHMRLILVLVSFPYGKSIQNYSARAKNWALPVRRRKSKCSLSKVFCSFCVKDLSSFVRLRSKERRRGQVHHMCVDIGSM